MVSTAFQLWKADAIADVVGDVLSMPAGGGRYAAAAFTIYCDSHMPSFISLPKEQIQQLIRDASKSRWNIEVDDFAGVITSSADWIETLDEWGNSAAWLYPGYGLPEGFVEMIAGAYGKEPHRGGLLRLLATICATSPTKPKCTMPSLGDLTDPELRRCVLTVKIAQGDWKAEGTSAISNELATVLIEDSRWGRSFLGAIEFSNASLQQRSDLLVKVFNRVACSHVNARQLLINSINELVKRRTSELDKSGSQLELRSLGTAIS